jgi:hypothetical protein
MGDWTVTQKDNGGPAFPTVAGQQVYSNGMSLRDWFAGQAVAGISANADWWACAHEDQIARQSYEIADAMLAARDAK